MLSNKLCLCLIVSIHILPIQSQSGPDPWNYDSKPSEISDELNIPPDLRLPIKRKVQSEQTLGIGEWFFRRILGIVLKGGQVKKDEDGNVDISLQMKFDPKQWEILDASLKYDTPLTEDMLRRSVGYVQESIYKPSIAEKISLAWSDYVEVYLTEYKTHITWILGFLAAAGGVLWLWSHMSRKHVLIIAFIILYAYEVAISYKEAEKKELDTFLAAVDRCKWFFWKSSCEVPSPDPLVFMKHMNPLKIGIRIFTTALAEPIIVISGTIEVILHGVTDGLWYPFDKITYGILTVVINISLIYFFIMIIFNYLLNIPFHIYTGFGLFGVSIRQRDRTLFSDNTAHESRRVQDTNRENYVILERIPNVRSLDLSSNKQHSCCTNVPMLPSTRTNPLSIRRSASTGRLPNLKSFESNSISSNYNVVTRRRPHDGSGDAR